MTSSRKGRDATVRVGSPGSGRRERGPAAGGGGGGWRGRRRVVGGGGGRRGVGGGRRCPAACHGRRAHRAAGVRHPRRASGCDRGGGARQGPRIRGASVRREGGRD